MASNVTIEVDGDEFNCDRGELVRQSPYFEAMFNGNFIEKDKDRISIQNLKSSAMKFILKWMKDSSQIESLKEDDILDVLQAASMLQFSQLQKSCEDIMLRHWLSADRCLVTATKADLLSLPKLYQKAFSLALWNFHEVRQTKAFLELTLEELVRFLGNDALFLGLSDDEFQVFEAASCWLEHKIEERKSVVLDVLSCVRMSFISISDLNSMLNYTSVDSCEDAQVLIKYILSMHDEDGAVFDKEDIANEEELQECEGDGEDDKGCCDILKKRLSDTLNAFTSEAEISEEKTEDSITELSNIKKCEEVNPDIVDYAQRILKSEKRSLPVVACIIGHYVEGEKKLSETVDDESESASNEIPKRSKKGKRGGSGSPYIFIWDGRYRKPVPFLPLTKIDEGPVEALGYTVVSTGQDLYVIGGEYLLGYGNWNKSVWKYNVWSETWIFETSLAVPRRHHSVVCLDDDLYVIGGCGKFRVIMNSVERYNFNSKTWHKCAPLPISLYSAATCVHNSFIYVISSQVFCYDPRRNRWVTLGDVNIPPGLSFNSAMPYGEYIFLTSRYTADLVRYNPLRENTVRRIGTFQNSAGDVCLVGSKIYSFTENNEVPCVEMYDIEKNSFEVLWTGDPRDKKISFKKLGGCFPLVVYESIWHSPKIDVEQE